MWKLSVDFEKCCDCEMCEVLLPQFRRINGGVILISDNNMLNEEIRASVEKVRDGFPEKAIALKRTTTPLKY